MLKIAICEDNPVHAEMIRGIASDTFPFPIEMNTFSSGTEFLASLPKLQCPYELVLMDIELGGNSLSGISLAENINLLNPNTQIIYISQYLEYISAVYETKHIYFVSKDLIDVYLPKALQAAWQKLQVLRKQFLYFTANQQKFQIPQGDILYMERILRNTEIHTRTAVYSTKEKLSALLEQLSPAFCPCHRSYAVNLRAASSLTRTEISFPNGARVPVGRTYYESVKQTFARLMLAVPRKEENL